MRTILVLVFAFAIIASGQQQPSAPAVPTNDAEAEVAAVLKAQRDYGRASRKSDEEALNTIWMPDYTFGNGNGVERSRQQCLDFLKATAAFTAKAPKGSFSTGHNTSKPNVRVHGDVAVVTGDRALGRRYSGVDGVVTFHYIEVWLKDAGRWRLLSNQLTPVKASPPAGH